MRVLQFLFAVALLWVLPILAVADERLGEYNAWALYRYTDNAGDTCTLFSTPTKSEGKYERRGAVYFHISSRAERQWSEDVSLTMGYPIKPDSEVRVSIDGGKNFNFYIQGEHAFLNEKQVPQMMKLMRAGNHMVIRGTSARGTETKDSFSLSGVTKGLNAMAEACR